MRRGHGVRTRILAGASALAIGAAALPLLAVPPSAAAAAVQDAEAERVYRQEALAHARAIAEAWRRLEGHILRRAAEATRWTGSVPPAEIGWLEAWTERGVRARYCEDTLLVYMAPAALKGVGRDQRAVQVAPHLYAPGSLPALHWLEGASGSGAASGSAGRAPVDLPVCLGDDAFGGPLPEGRAALAGVVRDPHLQRRERVSRERRVEDCPAGSHGAGRTMTREVRQAHDGRGTPVGDPVAGPWQVLIDACRADYSEWEHYALECRWFAGPPHNREMSGREVWRREKTVTADGIAWGTPEFVSTSCWEGRTPALEASARASCAQGEPSTAPTRSLPDRAASAASAATSPRCWPATASASISPCGCCRTPRPPWRASASRPGSPPPGISAGASRSSPGCRARASPRCSRRAPGGCSKAAPAGCTPTRRRSSSSSTASAGTGR